MTPVRFVVYSDYLCPWCYNASVRLRRLEKEFGGRVELEWRSYLLRPEPRRDSDAEAALEKFRAYSRSWLKVAEDPDGGTFQVWQGDEGPPSCSIPAHGVSKAAQAVGKEAFGAMHERLLTAYFGQSRDISRLDVLRDLWDELELPEAAFDVATRKETLNQVVAEHRQALEAGATGVPAVQLAGNSAVIVGAHPEALYRRWIERSLDRVASGEPLSDSGIGHRS